MSTNVDAKHYEAEPLCIAFVFLSFIKFDTKANIDQYLFTFINPFTAVSRSQNAKEA